MAVVLHILHRGNDLGAEDVRHCLDVLHDPSRPQRLLTDDNRFREHPRADCCDQLTLAVPWLCRSLVERILHRCGAPAAIHVHDHNAAVLGALLGLRAVVIRSRHHRDETTVLAGDRVDVELWHGSGAPPASQAKSHRRCLRAASGRHWSRVYDEACVPVLDPLHRRI